MVQPIHPENIMTWPRFGDIERRGDTHATFAGFEDNGPSCAATSGGKLCTRYVGHSDPHIAHASVVEGRFDVVETVKVWPL